MFNLSKKVVLISGGCGGLGQTLIAHLLKFDCKIIAIDINIDTKVENEQNSDNVLYLPCDVTNSQQVKEVLTKSLNKFGKLDILINNAGITHMSTLLDTELELINKIMNVNYMGSVNLTKICLPEIIRNKGQIVAISSVAGFAPLYGRSAYAGSKHAMEGFFGSVASEVKKFGVDTILVCPSFVNTRPELSVQVNNGVSSPGAAKKNTNGETISPDVAATEIINAMQRGQSRLLLGKVSKIAYWLHHLAPKLYNNIMRKGAKQEF